MLGYSIAEYFTSTYSLWNYLISLFLFLIKIKVKADIVKIELTAIISVTKLFNSFVESVKET